MMLFEARTVTRDFMTRPADVVVMEETVTDAPAWMPATQHRFCFLATEIAWLPDEEGHETFLQASYDFTLN